MLTITHSTKPAAHDDAVRRPLSELQARRYAHERAAENHEALGSLDDALAVLDEEAIALFAELRALQGDSRPLPTDTRTDVFDQLESSSD